jgi:hypothetical protein
MEELTNVMFDGGIFRGIDFWVHDFSLFKIAWILIKLQPIGIWLSVAVKVREFALLFPKALRAFLAQCQRDACHFLLYFPIETRILI